MTPAPLLVLASGPPRRIHLIGVAGSGMSGIAGLLLALGHRVSGSDKTDSGEVQRLRKLGLEFHTPHRAELVAGADYVIYSSAIKPGNPAYDEAARRGIPLVRRAEALASLLAAREGIVIAGMHGKTTTSAMAAHVLRGGGLRPSHYVGAEIPILGTNAHWEPDGLRFVIEGDESDGTLALYHAAYAIVLNIEPEHLDFYRDLAHIEEVFGTLLAQTSRQVFYCADDANATRVCCTHPCPVSFGKSAAADYRFSDLRIDRFASHFTVSRHGEVLGTAMLNVPGEHNVSNATGVIALAMELGMDFPAIGVALESFRGARRRFEFRYRGEAFSVVDDYAHHPSELQATLATARAAHPREKGRVIALFQPHRYSRTQALRREFGRAFHFADLLVVTDIYAASERPLPGVTGASIVEEAIAQGHPNAHHEPLVRRLAAHLGPKLLPGDLILTLGAGNIHEAARQLTTDLTHLEAMRALVGTDPVLLYEPLSRHTTLRVGGPAHYWAEPSSVPAFAALLLYAREQALPVFVLGRGSNLLVRDGGIDGLVIHPEGGEFARLEVDLESCTIRAGAGVKFKALAGAAARAGLGGFEWMEGIPGVVGGGLRMNAGAMNAETLDQVVSLAYLDAKGERHEVRPADLEVHYREVPLLRHNYAIEATFRGVLRPPEEIRELMEKSAAKRRSTQPIAASAGCIFKNPTKQNPAGRLIDELALKDSRVGMARVSEVHGNFIVNDGGAKAADVIELIAAIQARARRERGIELQTEVQIVGIDAA